MRCRALALLLVLGLTGLASAATGETPTTNPASVPITGIDGKAYDPLKVAPGRAAVLVFVLQDCPICNGYAPQIERLAAASRAQGVRFYLIHVDPALTPADARKHAAAYGYTIPVLIDRRHDLVRRLGVVAVPTAVVLDGGGRPATRAGLMINMSRSARHETL